MFLRNDHILRFSGDLTKMKPEMIEKAAFFSSYWYNLRSVISLRSLPLKQSNKQQLVLLKKNAKKKLIKKKKISVSSTRLQLAYTILLLLIKKNCGDDERKII